MGGARHSQTVAKTQWPDFLQPYAEALGKNAYDLLTPGGQVGQMPTGLNQLLAGFSPYQEQGISQIAGSASQQGQDVGAMRGSIMDTLGGKYLDPSTNPYLKETYGQAAKGLTDEYQLSTAPMLMAQAQRAGAFGGSAYDQTRQQNEYGLGQGLASLGNQIYGQNYQAERQRQLSAQQAVPGLMQAETMPGQALLGVGGLEQQQQQQGYDTNTQNAIRQFQFPQQQLEELGNLLGLARGGSGTSITTTPNRAGSLK
jgi:hypothetical protein